MLADALGYSEAFCGEHLSDALENIPNALLFLATLVDATKQIKLGPAVINLPHWHPAIVASNVAMLDNLLQGRFLLGVGPGVGRADAEMLDILDHDRNAMFIEALDDILALWEGEGPYDLKGRFWNIATKKTSWPELGLGGIAKPYQRPHPPILGASADPNSKSFGMLGRRGYWPISGDVIHPQRLRDHWTSYSAGCAETGRVASRTDWRIARALFVADDDARALAYAKTDPDSPYREHMSHLLKRLRTAKRMDCFKIDSSAPGDSVTLDSALDTVVIAGSVDRVIDQVLALNEMTGGFGTLIYAGKNWTDPNLSRRSMELMAERVMPAVNAALGIQVCKKI
jgi:alkanesulfonate monooxygenase SsuD/methylene tetrahydromethanopterin reductase-like flavin-dependent oxidoreductase (luciferase family)